MRLRLWNRGRASQMLVVALLCVTVASGARRTKLVKAVERGDLAEITKAFPKASGLDWLNALNAAVEGGHLQAVQWLVSNGPKLGDEVCDKKQRQCEIALPYIRPIFSGWTTATESTQRLYQNILTVLFDATEGAARAELASSSFITAVSRTSEQIVGFLLRHGADPNKQTRGEHAVVSDDGQGGYALTVESHKSGSTPLGAALTEKNTALVSLLLEAGANPNTPFTWKSWKLLDWAGFDTSLLESQARRKRVVIIGVGPPTIRQAVITTPLILATRRAHLEAVELLLSNGADVTATDDKGLTAIMHAEESNNSEIVNSLRVASGSTMPGRRLVEPLDVEESDKSELIEPRRPLSGSRTLGQGLVEASKGGDLAQCERLIRRGASTNYQAEDGPTPLYAASFAGHTETVRLLLANGAHVNFRSNGTTALYVAAQNGHLETVGTLLSNGADVRTGTGNAAPLYAASQKGHREVVQILLSNGADIDARTKRSGSTALAIAAYNGHLVP